MGASDSLPNPPQNPGIAPLNVPHSPAGPRDDPRPEGFGLATATFAVVSSMIGTGVLTTSGYAVLGVRSNGLMLLLWAVGGVIAACGALSLAELSAMLPRSGGEYVILDAAYGPRAAFLAGWVTLLLGFTAPIAATASAAATYLLAPYGLAKGLPVTLLGTAGIVVMATVHASGPRRAAGVQGSITLANLLLLAGLVAAGCIAGRHRVGNVFDRPVGGPPSVVSTLGSLVFVAYAYTGWNAASYLAGEVRDPGRLLPRAILLGCGGVVLLYLGLNLVYALALPAAELIELARRDGRAAVEPIAELAASRLFGPEWVVALSLAIGVLLLGSLGALLFTGPRVARAMARDGRIPDPSGRLGGSPAAATWLLALAALAMLWTGSFEAIVRLSGVGLALFSLATVGALYVLRRRRPGLARPFRVPGYPVVPAIYLALTSCLVVSSAVEDPATAALACATILAGLPVHAWSVRRLGA